MEQVSYKFISNEKVQICIPLEGRLKLIDAETVVSPDGDRCVVYDNYVVSLKQMWQNATDIDFYLEKIQQAYDCLTDGLSKIDTLKKITTVPFRNLPVRIGSAYSNRLTLSREQSC